MNDALLQGYNDVPYTSAPDPARHPERLATIGTLLGLDVAPVATCRVLELACGDGANLVTIAATLTGATFVGFDFAAAPIARAKQMVNELRLGNVRVLELDLREVPADLGTFDYIIAHGLYSWVPADVRAHVMPLVARHLAPNGVALVSYNAMPGCHLRGIVWDMLKYHTRNLPEKSAKVAAARALLDFVATPVDGESSSQQTMRAEVRSAARSSDASLAHDDLSAPNDAFYFHEIVDDASRAGLTFLAEARPESKSLDGLAPKIRDSLERLDRLTREQYLDFVVFRHFRESLFCHANATTTFAFDPARVLGLHATPSLALRRAAPDREAAQRPESATNAIERRLLARWPQSVALADLASARDVQTAAAAEAATIEQLVIALWVSGRIDLRTTPVAVAVDAGECPEAFGAARWINRENEVIPSLYHESLRYQDPLGRKLLSLLDGTRTRDDLCAELGGPFAGSDGRVRLDRALSVLAGKALLIAPRVDA